MTKYPVPVLSLAVLALQMPVAAVSAPAPSPAKPQWQSIGAAASLHSTFSMTSGWWISSAEPQRLANCASSATGAADIVCVAYSLPKGRWEALNATQAPYQTSSKAQVWLKNQSSILMCDRFLGGADAITCVAASLPQVQGGKIDWRPVGSSASPHDHYSMTSAWFYVPTTVGAHTAQQISNCAATLDATQIVCKSYALPAGDWEPMTATQTAYQLTSQAQLWLKNQDSVLMCRHFLLSDDPITCSSAKLPPLPPS